MSEFTRVTDITEISTVIDLNTLTRPGVYQMSHNELVGTNYPPNAVAGLIEVFGNPAKPMVWQRYTTYGLITRVWRRGFYSGTWGQWMPLSSNIIASQTLTVNTGTFPGLTVYSAPNSAPTLTRSGNTVMFQGALRGAAGTFGTNTLEGIMTAIPVGFRPVGNYSGVYVCQGSSLNKWAMTVGAVGVGAPGRVDFGRYGPDAMVNDTWLPFSATWVTTEAWPTTGITLLSEGV